MRRILVVQSGKLGDMVCTTPVFRALKQHDRTASLVVAGDKINKEVLRGNPNVDEYADLEDLSKEKIRELSLDAAVLLNPNPKLLWDLLRARVPQIIVPEVMGGFSPYATKTYKLLSLFATRVPHRMGYYAPQEYLNMLNPLGINATDTTKELFYSEEAKLKADEILSQSRRKLRVGISPSAGNKIKNWGGNNFARVAEALVRRGDTEVMVIGSERDREEVEEMISHLDANTPVVNLLGKLSIDELKAIMSKIDLFIAVDTGPIYIAEAFGVATVDIIGPMDEREQPPRGPRHRLVYIKERKAPALHIMNARTYDAAEARRQIEGITPEMVIGAAESLLD